ncbi:hypothetical protein M514_02117 [Trichuris suis]|uniref:Uncharacterized protein n=1 Tax=Trichuris suis TaxID=68888 RepID=A0A085MWX1_9BILA|nr:hypothetical protein M513_02117 [Trichuris suis]KFD61717.1 hypothetical protein M514_02117 [Trichuris suis]
MLQSHLYDELANGRLWDTLATQILTSRILQSFGSNFIKSRNVYGMTPVYLLYLFYLTEFAGQIAHNHQNRINNRENFKIGNKQKKQNKVSPALRTPALRMFAFTKELNLYLFSLYERTA